MTVLARSQRGAAPSARALASFGLSERELLHLDRFLDVTKASLLFARGVLLVEGVAEQILAPELARAVGVSLADEGIAVINVGGLSFAPFAALFGPERLPYHCAIVTDADATDDSEQEEGTDELLSPTAQKLKDLANENVGVFFSRKTFEWDLVVAGNWEIMVAALQRVKPQSARKLGEDHGSDPLEDRASALLATISRIKGRFAQAVLEELRERDSTLTVPGYFAEAIRLVAGPVPDEDGDEAPLG